MTNSTTITEDDILEKVTERSFQRGRQYYDWDMVESAIQRRNRLFAEVLGSDWEPYHVGVALQEADFSASCTCPYDWGGYYKHIVAVLLTFIHDRDRITTRPPTEELLSKLGADELKALVVQMVECDPKLAVVVDSLCVQAVP